MQPSIFASIGKTNAKQQRLERMLNQTQVAAQVRNYF
jgi:hypothetical protein